MGVKAMGGAFVFRPKPAAQEQEERLDAARRRQIQDEEIIRSLLSDVDWPESKRHHVLTLAERGAIERTVSRAKMYDPGRVDGLLRGNATLQGRVQFLEAELHALHAHHEDLVVVRAGGPDH